MTSATCQTGPTVFTPATANVQSDKSISQPSTLDFDETDDSAELIYLLNRQEKAILFQLCAHQLYRLVELSPEALKSLMSYPVSVSDHGSRKHLSVNKTAATNSTSSPNCRPQGVSLTDRAKSALFTWGKTQSGASDVTIVDISVVKTLSDHLCQGKPHFTLAFTSFDIMKKRCFSDLDLEGLFRVPGNLLRVDKLREGIKNGELVNLLRTGYFTQHDIASVLKSYLSNLELIPAQTHLTHLTLASLTHSLDHERCVVKENNRLVGSSLESINHHGGSDSVRPSSRFHRPESCSNVETLVGNYQTLSLFEKKKKQHMEALQIMFCMLSANQRSVLKLVLSLLYQVAKKKSITKMTASNLATIFAPHFFSSNPMVDI